MESQDKELKCINKLYESSHGQKHQHTEKRRKQVHQAKSSCEVEVTKNALNEADQELCDAMRAFIANDGGLLRMTFHEAWHQNHPQAAKNLWGYHTWNME